MPPLPVTSYRRKAAVTAPSSIGSSVAPIAMHQGRRIDQHPGAPGCVVVLSKKRASQRGSSRSQHDLQQLAGSFVASRLLPRQRWRPCIRPRQPERMLTRVPDACVSIVFITAASVVLHRASR